MLRRRPLVLLTRSLTRQYSTPTTETTTQQEQPVDPAQVAAFFKRGKKKYRDEEDPKQKADPKVLLMAKYTAWKALGIATLINIAVAICVVLIFRYYVNIKTMPQLQQWIRKTLDKPELPINESQSEKLRQFFGVHDEPQEDDHDFSKK
jgi:hypothetical protein